MLRTSDTDCAGAVFERLTAAAIDGTLTADQIGTALGIVDKRPGFSTQSAGLNWIHRNIEWFAEVVPNAADFFGKYVHNKQVMQVFNFTELFDLLPLENRTVFMKTAFQLHDPFGNRWVRIASTARVPMPDYFLAELVLSLIESADIDILSRKKDYVTSVFLPTGAGTPRMTDALAFRPEPGSDDDMAENWVLDDAHTLWSVLSNNELVQAMQMVIRKEPTLIFQPAPRVEDFSLRQLLLIRLDRTVVQTICAEAAQALDSMNSVDPDEFAWLPLHVRKETANRMKGGSIDLVIQIAMEIHDAYEAGQFIKRHEAVFRGKKRHLHDAALRYWGMLQESDQKLRAGMLIGLLRHNLERCGYAVGQVETEKFSRRQRYYVTHKGRKYVRHQMQDDCQPSQGDWVMFEPRSARLIESKIHLFGVDFELLDG